ncbi:MULTISPECIES: hypothetical protein [Corynebacterium]|uniref:Chitin-binding type-3 domain-containing protein n=1 Tax=Corynebacterium ihumii TaxID=1232427 RepID=A0ABY7UAH3_9CORY|nr:MULTISPECIES: hypothetical protein [Corynebacterium]WCZ33670.1 hypothetical protein CIHUM_01115 [Corynebacterium ihumii]
MEQFTAALDALTPDQYPEAAREIVMRLTDRELRDHRLYCSDEEPKRRQREQDKAEAQAELVAELQEQHPELAPKYATQLDEVGTLEDLFAKLPDWVQPTSKASSYPPMSLVKHQEKAYRARRLTDKEPDTPFSGWEDVTADFLRPEPIADGNADEVGADAPGLITEPEEPENITPAPQVEEWKAGELVTKGTTRLHDGALYVSRRLHTTTQDKAPGNETYWQKLD